MIVYLRVKVEHADGPRLDADEVADILAEAMQGLAIDVDESLYEVTDVDVVPDANVRTGPSGEGTA